MLKLCLCCCVFLILYDIKCVVRSLLQFVYVCLVLFHCVVCLFFVLNKQCLRMASNVLFSTLLLGFRTELLFANQ